MQPILAIIGLTWKAAFRYRLFWMIVVLLLVAVAGMPLIIKDDGTAQGLTQIVLTYTLGATTALLGLCTLWLACGTLARDVEECQIQMIAVKPVGRWQIWLGKWLGLVTLDAALLAIAWMSIYSLLEWRAGRLPPDQITKLRNEVLVARGSLKEDRAALEAEIMQNTDRVFKDRLTKNNYTDEEQKQLRQQIYEQVKSAYQVVPPGRVSRPWIIHFGLGASRLRDQQLFLRVKFNSSTSSSSGTFDGEWQVGNPNTMQPWQSDVMSLAPDTFHEFSIPANAIDANGNLVILFRNPNENAALLFPLEDGMEVLYREGGFGLNFARGLGIILCWMALLAALGLAAASFLSFPVAAFLSLGVLTVVLSSGTIAGVVSDNAVVGYTDDSWQAGRNALNKTMVPVFRVALDVINLVQQFSPVDALSTGRKISWTQLGHATAQVVVLLGGILAGFGMYVFYRRELATAQGTH